MQLFPLGGLHANQGNSNSNPEADSTYTPRKTVT